MADCGTQLEKLHGKTSFMNKTNAYDVVTQSDILVEETLKNALASVYPDIPFVGEETGGDYTNEEFWLVDPIDGTIHFTRGLPFTTIMVSLIQNNKPVVGTIYNFMNHEFFAAYKGGGATLNGKPIHTSKRSVDEALILAEINLSVANNPTVLKHLDERFKIINTCSAGFEFSLVAQGTVEARIAKDPYGKAYDFAAGALIVTEAGGIVRELSGGDFTINSRDFVAASSEKLFQEITRLINKPKERPAQ